MRVNKQQHFEQGKLVEVGENTYDIVFPDSNRSKKLNPYREKYRAKKEASRTMYLSAGNDKVLDRDGVLLSDEVLVIRTAEHNGFKQVFLRFYYNNAIWSGYTLNADTRPISAKVTKLLSLDEGIAKDTRVCRECGNPFKRVRRQVICNACRKAMPQNPECSKKVEEKLCATEGCGRPISRNNKTGYCRKCHSTQGEFAVVRREFNPFYNCVVVRKRKGDNATEVISDDTQKLS